MYVEGDNYFEFESLDDLAEFFEELSLPKNETYCFEYKGKEFYSTYTLLGAIINPLGEE